MWHTSQCAGTDQRGTIRKKFPPKGVDGIVGTREIVGIARKSSRKNSIPIGLVPGLHIPRGLRGVKKKDFSNTYVIVYISLVFVE